MVCANPDPTEMAQQFLKLWQKHITQSMHDPATMHGMLQSMRAFYGAADDAPTRSAAAAPDAADDAIRRLTRRVARLEQSVGALVARLDAAEKPARTQRRSVGKRVAKSQPAAQRRKPAVVKAKSKSAKRKLKR